MGTYILVSLALTALFAVICIVKNYFTAAELRKRANDPNDYWQQEKKEEYAKLKKRRLFVLAGWCTFTFASLLLVNWLATPAISLSRSAIYWEALFVVILNLLAFEFDEDEDYRWSPHSWGMFAIFGLGMAVTECGSGQWIQDGRHQALLDMANDDVEMITSSDTLNINQDSLFNESISPVSMEKMRVVSGSAAMILAEQLMGQITAFGSQYEIGMLSLQSITGEFDITDGTNQTYHLKFEDDFIYVAPLEFRSFWKWRETDGISRAYVIVSATNENEYYLVLKVNGKSVEMKYLQSAYFSHELRRHVRYSGYMGKIADTGMQIDANGQPYNVFAKVENQIGWGGDKVVGSLVVDVQNGEIKEYSLEETPDFIDIVQPDGLLRTNIYKHYDLIHGFINWSDKDVLRPAKKLQVVYGENTCCYYTGLTSTGKDQSTSGFILSDAKTGVTTFYKMSGISEDRAESAIAAHEWTAKYPSYWVGNAVMYNIGGLQTYYSPITSGNKIVGHGFCYAKNVNVVGAGKTKEEAFAAYMRSYHLSLQQQSIPEDGKNVEGKILTIAKMRQEGNRYNFQFAEYEGKTFYAFSEMVPEVRWIDETTKKVLVSFRISDDSMIPIKSISTTY